MHMVGSNNKEIINTFDFHDAVECIDEVKLKYMDDPVTSQTFR